MGNNQQIDILEEYAKCNRAISLYCFYNYLNDIDLNDIHLNYFHKNIYWHCCLPYKAIKTRGKKNFDYIHSLNDTKPWRCLVRCPALLQVHKNKSCDGTNFDFDNLRVYSELPKEITEANNISGLEQFPDTYYNRDIRVFPRRIIIAEYKGDEDDRVGRLFGNN